MFERRFNLFMSVALAATSSSAYSSDGWSELDRVAQLAGNSLCRAVSLRTTDSVQFGALRNGLRGCSFSWGEDKVPVAVMELDERGDLYFHFDLVRETVGITVANYNFGAVNSMGLITDMSLNLHTGRFDWILSANCSNSTRRCDNANVAVKGVF